MRTPKHVLVTGSSGFIGMKLVETLLGMGIAVTGLDLHRPGRAMPGADSVVGSFTEPHVVYGLLRSRPIDTIVHAGGVSGPMLARDTPFAICEANVLGTIHLLEAARLSGVGRFVQCGSAAAFGDTPPAPVPDDAPLAATGLYASTKGAADLILRAYRHDYGLDTVSLRISNAYGPGRRTRCAIRTMISDALAGQPTRMEWGGGYGRAYLYVNDAVSAIIAAMRAPSLPQWAYNVAGGEFPAMEAIAAVVKRLLPGADITMKDGVDALGYRREALDLGAAARDLGWAPQFTIESGIVAYVDWMRQAA